MFISTRIVTDTLQSRRITDAARRHRSRHQKCAQVVLVTIHDDSACRHVIVEWTARRGYARTVPSHRGIPSGGGEGRLGLEIDDMARGRNHVDDLGVWVTGASA